MEDYLTHRRMKVIKEGFLEEVTLDFFLQLWLMVGHLLRWEILKEEQNGEERCPVQFWTA